MNILAQLQLRMLGQMLGLLLCQCSCDDSHQLRCLFFQISWAAQTFPHAQRESGVTVCFSCCASGKCDVKISFLLVVFPHQTSQVVSNINLSPFSLFHLSDGSTLLPHFSFRWTGRCSCCSSWKCHQILLVIFWGKPDAGRISGGRDGNEIHLFVYWLLPPVWFWHLASFGISIQKKRGNKRNSMISLD